MRTSPASIDLLQTTAGRLRVVCLGAGRVAGHLLPALAAAGHQVVGVWSRQPATARLLAGQLPAAAVVAELAGVAALRPDVVLVSVPDAAVGAVVAAAALPPGVIVAHTAGSLPLPAHERAGVFYPLQTFSAERPIDLRPVPLCLEATDAATGAVLAVLAHSISDRVVWLDAAQRARLHLAAVFASNFPNHLLGVSELILRAGGGGDLTFDLLAPLVQEVVAKALQAVAGPFSVQTGPAARHDVPTLDRHRAALAADPNLLPWLPVYEALTAAIERVSREGAPPGHTETA